MIIQKASAVVSPDPVVKRYVSMRHHVYDSIVIPYGIDAQPASPSDIRRLRKELEVEGDQIILSLGHVNRLRNRKDLIEAMRIVVQQFSNSRLLIVGEVNWKEPVELVEQLCLSKNVAFTGAMPRTQVPALFAL